MKIDLNYWMDMACDLFIPATAIVNIMEGNYWLGVILAIFAMRRKHNQQVE